MCSGTVDVTGDFTCTGMIPGQAGALGTNKIVIRDSVGEAKVKLNFTLT